MAGMSSITITYRITNRKALKALGVVARYVDEHTEGREWDAEAVAAAKAMKVVMSGLRAKIGRDDA